MTSKVAKIPKSGKKGKAAISLSEWDRGATGEANQDGLIEEPATDFNPVTGRDFPNPNGVKRRRREDWVARYTKAGHITREQAAHAVKLRMASEGMRERDPIAAIGETRCVGGDPQAARIDARRYFRTLWAAIPIASRAVVERVVIDDMPLWKCNAQTKDRHFKRLGAGLDALAEGARKTPLTRRL